MYRSPSKDIVIPTTYSPDTMTSTSMLPFIDLLLNRHRATNFATLFFISGTSLKPIASMLMKRYFTRVDASLFLFTALCRPLTYWFFSVPLLQR